MNEFNKNNFIKFNFVNYGQQEDERSQTIAERERDIEETTEHLRYYIQKAYYTKNPDLEIIFGVELFNQIYDQSVKPLNLTVLKEPFWNKKNLLVFPVYPLKENIEYELTKNDFFSGQIGDPIFVYNSWINSLFLDQSSLILLFKNNPYFHPEKYEGRFEFEW